MVTSFCRYRPYAGLYWLIQCIRMGVCWFPARPSLKCVGKPPCTDACLVNHWPSLPIIRTVVASLSPDVVFD